MKQFNIAKNQQIVFGHIIPKNAIYGKFTYNWEYKKITGQSVVKDKNGNVRYNKNGMPKIKTHYKVEKRRNSCVYCLESIKTFRHKDTTCLGAYVLYENANKWQYVHLGGTVFLNALNEHIEKCLLEYTYNNCVSIAEMDEKIATPFVKGVDDKITKPVRKNVQKEYLYRGYGYALRGDIINENVKPRTPIIHTNLKACKDITPKHERYASPYTWEYGKTPKRSGNIEAVAAMNKNK